MQVFGGALSFDWFGDCSTIQMSKPHIWLGPANVKYFPKSSVKPAKFSLLPNTGRKRFQTQ